jgi:phosphoribosylanthranilate isomerase
VRPYAVDVASGVEVDGDARRKSGERMGRFFAAIRR